MFGIYFKSSLKALPVLVLLPIIAFVVFALVNDIMPERNGMFVIESFLQEWFSYDGGSGAGLVWMRNVMIIAILVNFLLLMIIPAAAGGIDPVVKQRQFYFGFFVNIALMLLFPVLIFALYKLNGTGLGILLGLSLLSFTSSFIIGSRLVAPAYVRAFWFSH